MGILFLFVVGIWEIIWVRIQFFDLFGFFWVGFFWVFWLVFWVLGFFCGFFFILVFLLGCFVCLF